MNEYLIFFNNNGNCVLEKFETEFSETKLIEFIRNNGYLEELNFPKIEKFYLKKIDTITDWYYFEYKENRGVYKYWAFTGEFVAINLYELDKTLFNYINLIVNPRDYGKCSEFIFSIQNGCDLVNKYYDKIISNPYFNRISYNKYKFKTSLVKVDYVLDLISDINKKKYFEPLLELVRFNSIFDDYNNFNTREDLEKHCKIIEDFDNPKVKALIKKAGYSLDLRDYKGFNDVYRIIDEVYYAKIDIVNGNLDGIIKQTLFYEDNEWFVCIPTNHEESKLLGKRTNWCTAADSDNSCEYFNNYSKDSPLIIFINKKDIEDKYQFHYISEQFLNKYDEEFNVEATFSEEFIKKYVNFTVNNLTLDNKEHYIPNYFSYLFTLDEIKLLSQDFNTEVSELTLLELFVNKLQISFNSKLNVFYTDFFRNQEAFEKQLLKFIYSDFNFYNKGPVNSGVLGRIIKYFNNSSSDLPIVSLANVIISKDLVNKCVLNRYKSGYHKKIIYEFLRLIPKRANDRNNYTLYKTFEEYVNYLMSLLNKNHEYYEQQLNINDLIRNIISDNYQSNYHQLEITLMNLIYEVDYNTLVEIIFKLIIQFDESNWLTKINLFGNNISQKQVKNIIPKMEEYLLTYNNLLIQGHKNNIIKFIENHKLLIN